jgi:hypothetical protein
MNLPPANITDMRPQDILMPVPAGLCCKQGGFHIGLVPRGWKRWNGC